MQAANNDYQTLGYNTPSMNASSRLSSDKVQVAKLSAEDNVKKTSFRGQPYKRHHWPLFHDVMTHKARMDRVGSGTKVVQTKRNTK